MGKPAPDGKTSPRWELGEGLGLMVVVGEDEVAPGGHISLRLGRGVTAFAHGGKLVRR